MVKVLLIEPPPVSKFGNQRNMGCLGSKKADFSWPPLGSMIIAGYLRKKGVSSSIYDADAAKKNLLDIEREIVKQKPSVIVIEVSLPTLHKDLLIADVAKKCSNKILTVAIAPYLREISKEVFKKYRNLDVIPYNEPEQIIYNLVKNKNNLRKVTGIIYRSNGKIVKNPPQPICKNLDELGFPTHDKIDKNLYHDVIAKSHPITMVMGQRGCTSKCTFCCHPPFFAPFRKRSIKHVIKELRWIKKLGFKEVMFNDSGITNDLRWANELFDEMIKNKFGFKWLCCIRAGYLNEEIVKKMKKAGCHAIYIGMESADLRVLKNAKKDLVPEQVRDAVSLIRKYNIDALVFCMLGLPGETKESMEETIRFAKSLNTNYITLGIAVPVPGTEFYDYVEKNGYLITKDWRRYDPLKRPVYNYPNLSSNEIYATMRRGLKSFYLRPFYIIKLLFSMRSFGDLKRNVKNGIAFIKRFVFGGK